MYLASRSLNEWCLSPSLAINNDGTQVLSAADSLNTKVMVSCAVDRWGKPNGRYGYTVVDSRLQDTPSLAIELSRYALGKPKKQAKLITRGW